MDRSSRLGREHEIFMTWVQDRGVHIRGIEPARFSERGLGIIAQRDIKKGEELVTVPTSALFSEDLIPKQYKNLHRSISTHGLLASFMAFGDPVQTCVYAAWRATWPSAEDFQLSMPILWPRYVRSRVMSSTSTNPVPSTGLFPLPPAIGGQWARQNPSYTSHGAANLLHKQEMRLEKDWAVVSRVLPDAEYDKYVYNWLIVNTRSFYYELSCVKRTRSRSDCMVLCPFVDCFNHADRGCVVIFDEKGFKVKSDRDYEIGEEIYVSYGSHSNDFLLTEYGFVLANNKWDYLHLDDLILPMLDSETQARLKEARYLGNYTLSSDGVCHRTQVAMRTQTLGYRDWKMFVEGRETEMEVEDDEAKADAHISREVLSIYHNEAKNALECLRNGVLQDRKEIKAVLSKRWTQIEELVRPSVLG